ncbi:MAG: hypothetical protein AAEJ04_09160 [Planctomycetota bacterium]
MFDSLASLRTRYASGSRSSSCCDLDRQSWYRRFLLLSLLAFLSMNPTFVFAGDLFDPRSEGPVSDHLFEALQLDLEQNLGPALAATMEISWVREAENGRTFVGWTQSIQGIEVRGGLGRSVVFQDSASGLFSVRHRAFSWSPLVEISGAVMDVEHVLNLVSRNHPSRTWAEPFLEIVAGDAGTSFLVWVLNGTSDLPAHHSSLRIDVDATNGRILAVEEQVCEIDVPGTVSVVRTPGTEPQSSSVSGQVFTLGGAQISGGTATTHSNEDGSFLLERGSGANFTVLAELRGTWGGVSSAMVANATDSAAADPGGVDLLINSADDTSLTAQANAFHYIESGFRFFMDSPGGFPAMGLPFNATTGMAGTCNAFYDPTQSMLRFLRPGGGCVDSAYSSVVLHEFGHHIVDSLGLVQGAFGEGYGDSLAIVYLGEGIIGQDFSGPGQHVRDVENADVVVPCSGGIHFCGQALGGFWFDVGFLIRDKYGPVAGSTLLRNLFVDWSSVTVGGLGSQPIHDNMILEVLMADDDDGDLGNGTPNWDEICSAAGVRGLSCPDLVTLSLELVQGPGELVSPGVPIIIQVQYTEILAAPLVDGSSVFWRNAAGSWQSFPLVQVGSQILEGNFPVIDCLDQVDWYVRVEDDLGLSTSLPPGGALSPFSTIGATDSAQVVEESLATNPGWSTSDPSDAALFGIWEWGVPVGSNAQASAGVPGPGGDQSCYVTGIGSVGDAAGVHDVDFGETTLTSIEYPLSDTGRHRVSYWRWFSNSTSITIPDDVLTIWKSLDGGVSWIVVETVGPGDSQASGGWFQNSFWIDEGESSTTSLMLRFRTGDLGAGSITEAGIDLLQIVQISCAGGPPPPPPVENDYLRGDCNVDGSQDISDAVQMLEVLFGSSTSYSCADACDFDDGGQVDLADVILLLQVLFQGGSGGSSICGPDPTSDSLGCEQATICP